MKTRDIGSILAAHTTSNLPSETKQRYAQGLKSAEKLAQLVTHTRVRLAVACILISEVSQLWLKGAPNETLYSISQSVDKQTEDILRMLVEIAQATKQETIPPRGIQNGLTRAARAITTLRQRIVQAPTLVTGSALRCLNVFTSIHPANSPLAEAIADGFTSSAFWVNAARSFTRSVCEVLYGAFQARHRQPCFQSSNGCSTQHLQTTPKVNGFTTCWIFIWGCAHYGRTLLMRRWTLRIANTK